MKTREEQIEEMARAICATGVALDGTDYAFGVYADDDHFHKMASALYDAGYRKQRDTVREFVERLKKNEHCCQEGNIVYWVIDVDDIAEVAAEYGAEVEE